MFMFPCVFALFVFALPALALAGVADLFALPVFELLDVAQPAQRTVTISKSTKFVALKILPWALGTSGTKCPRGQV